MTDTTNKKITILGAGITGLSLGSFLSDNGYAVTILEKSDTVGGMIKSFTYKKNTLDYGPHKIYSQIPGVMDEFKNITSNQLLKIRKYNSIRLMGKYFGFPVSIPRVVLGINPVKSARLGMGFGFVSLRNIFWKNKSGSYEEYLVNGFGRPAYDIMFRDLAWKVWGNPQKLSEELARRRVPAPNLLQLLFKGSGKGSDGQEISAKYFYYPKNGGIGYLAERYAKNIIKNKGNIIVECHIKKIHHDQKSNKIQSISYSIRDKNEDVEVKTDFLVSTIYLQDMLSYMSNVPKKVINSASNLKYRSLILVYFISKKSDMKGNQWIFFPEKEYVFNRVSEHNQFNKGLVERGTSVITAEIACDPDDMMVSSSNEYIYRRVIDDLEKSGILKEEDVKEFFIKKATRVYPIYSIDYKKNLTNVFEYTDTFENLITLGRAGLYNYNNIDHCIDMSAKSLEYINGYFEDSKNLATSWKKMREYFNTYKIVD